MDGKDRKRCLKCEIMGNGRQDGRPQASIKTLRTAISNDDSFILLSYTQVESIQSTTQIDSGVTFLG